MAHCYLHFIESLIATFFKQFPSRRRGVVVITTAQLHSTRSELRFCAGSNPSRSVSQIRNGEDLWQWSRLEITLNTSRRSTIPPPKKKKKKKKKKRINSILLKDIALLAVKFNVCNKLNYILPSLWEPYHWTGTMLSNLLR